jgi:acetyl-CoA carboxylase biotin carboxyl carrier protein
VEFSWEQLRELILALNQTDIAEFSLEAGEWKLNIRKRDPQGQELAPRPPLAQEMPVSPSPEPPASQRKIVDIVSYMVGTFYRAPSPDDPPFVEVGDMVKRGDTVCIIEAMKVMNQIESEVSGRIVEILVENAQPVEFGQVLMRVEV